MEADDIARERIAALDRLFQSEIQRIEDSLVAQERAVSLLGNANEIAQNKFEATVKDGFVKQNEFRGSLDDLGKTMATRRELEASQDEYRRAHQDLVNVVSDLRSRVDVGPSSLRELQAQADIQAGRREEAQQFTANTYALMLVLVTIAGIAGHYIH